MRVQQIYVMDKGEFVEADIIFVQKKGLYYDLWKEQLPETNEIKKEPVIPSIPCSLSEEYLNHQWQRKVRENEDLHTRYKGHV